MDASVIKPVAEATRAVAETSGKAIDATSDFAKIFKGPVAELIGCVEDKFKYVRWERRQALIAKSEAHMRSKGLSAPSRALPLPFSVPLLTAGILEDDDELQEIWARLLVNAGDASTNMELRTAYVEILRGMSSFDVKNLSLMAQASIDAPEKGYLPIIETWNLPHSVTVHDEHSKDAGSVSNELGISLANLGRLGCLSPGMGWGGVALFNLMTVTHLGRSLYLACS
jgi:hypothetical protein